MSYGEDTREINWEWEESTVGSKGVLHAPGLEGNGTRAASYCSEIPPHNNNKLNIPGFEENCRAGQGWNELLYLWAPSLPQITEVRARLVVRS